MYADKGGSLKHILYNCRSRKAWRMTIAGVSPFLIVHNLDTIKTQKKHKKKLDKITSGVYNREKIEREPNSKRERVKK